jgi:hypothetical protein
MLEYLAWEKIGFMCGILGGTSLKIKNEKDY